MWSKLIVDMNTLSVSREPLDEDFRELGGKGLIAQYMIKNVPPQCDPLGEQNQLIFCLGIFAGTSFTTAHRLSVGGKSPLTGGIKESNVGGYAGTLLAEQGIKMIILRGLPEKEGPSLLHIDSSGKAELLDAAEYKGMGNYDLREKLPAAL